MIARSRTGHRACCRAELSDFAHGGCRCDRGGI